MKCVASCIIMSFTPIPRREGTKKIEYHDAISVLIFIEICVNDRYLTCNVFVGFCKTMCGFSKPEIQQFYLVTYPPKRKWASYEIILFSFLVKSTSLCSFMLAQQISTLLKRKLIHSGQWYYVHWILWKNRMT